MWSPHFPVMQSKCIVLAYDGIWEWLIRPDAVQSTSQSEGVSQDVKPLGSHPRLFQDSLSKAPQLPSCFQDQPEAFLSDQAGHVFLYTRWQIWQIFTACRVSQQKWTVKEHQQTVARVFASTVQSIPVQNNSLA